jgi:hypothetical protein
MHTHAQHTNTYNTAQHSHVTPAYKKKRAKEHNLFKVSIFGAEVVISAKHISSAPKGESSSTVELQIGGVTASELVWWSWSPPK